jgi:hypothetical protein
MMHIPNRSLRLGITWALIAAFTVLATACAGLPVESPTPTPEIFIARTQAVPGTPIPAPSISGVALWGSSPVAGARVELRMPGWRATPGDPANTVAVTTAGADGRFAFEDAPAGDWTLVAIWPDGEESAGATPPANTESGQPVDTTIRMERKLTLEEPTGTTAGPTPMLRWSSLPEAAGYRVWIIDAGTTELVVNQDTSDPTFSVATPLTAGRTYQILVSALDAEGQPLANAQAEVTVTDAGAAVPQPSPAYALTLPPVCLQEGLATYFNLETGICFALPHGFAVADPAQLVGTITGQPAGQGPEPLFASLTVEVKPAEGKELATLVDEHLAQYSEIPVDITRTPITFAGAAAEVLDPVPGRLSSRQIVVSHGPEKFYILTLWPSFADTPAEQVNAEGQQAEADVDRLYEALLAGFAFLPPEGVPIADGVTVRQSCLSSEQAFVLRPAEGYCLALPQEFALLPQADGSLSMAGPALDQGPEPARASLAVTVKPAAGQTLRQIVDDYVDQLPPTEIPVKQTELSLGGEPAIRLDGVPSRNGTTEIMAVHNDTLYDLVFQPDPQGVPQAADDWQRLLDLTTGTFTFLEWQ